jgi:hypothetical protein
MKKKKKKRRRSRKNVFRANAIANIDCENVIRVNVVGGNVAAPTLK